MGSLGEGLARRMGRAKRNPSILIAFGGLRFANPPYGLRLPEIPDRARKVYSAAMSGRSVSPANSPRRLKPVIGILA
jgi:hypothetical protein